MAFRYFVSLELRRYELLMVSVTHLAISMPPAMPRESSVLRTVAPIEGSHDESMK